MATSLLHLTSRIPTRTSLWALLVLLPASALWLLSLQRAVEPHGVPQLRLDAAEVAAVMAEDARLVASAQLEDPEFHALDAQLLELGLAQREALEPSDRFVARRDAMRRGVSTLIRSRGVGAAAALRARALARVEAAIEGHVPVAQIPGLMGSFANLLTRHGLVVDGRVLAPRFVVRTLYKARWNLAYSLENDHDMRPVERRALHGWLGLHGEQLMLDARLAALKAYAQLDGPGALEAQGVLLYQGGDYENAAAALQHAHDQRGGHLRIRNFALGTRLSGRLDE